MPWFPTPSLVLIAKCILKPFGWKSNLWTSVLNCWVWMGIPRKCWSSVTPENPSQCCLRARPSQWCGFRSACLPEWNRSYFRTHSDKNLPCKWHLDWSSLQVHIVYIDYIMLRPKSGGKEIFFKHQDSETGTCRAQAPFQCYFLLACFRLGPLHLVPRLLVPGRAQISPTKTVADFCLVHP